MQLAQTKEGTRTRGGFSLALLAVFNPKCSNKTKEQLTFADLPTDVVLLIADELSLPSKYMLSQTCGAMWHLLAGPCTQQIIQFDKEFLNTIWTDERRLEFLCGIAETQPHRVLCEGCSKLEDINTKDTPRRRLSIPGDCRVGLAMYDFGMDYQLYFHHVQLAIKYARLGDQADSKCRRYFSELMESHSRRFRLAHGPRTYSGTVFTQPKVIGGQFYLYSHGTLKRTNQFLLLFRRDPEYPSTWAIRAVPNIKICHHRRIPDLPQCVASTGSSLEERTAAMLKSWDGKRQHYSCDRCPTDYTITSYPGKEKLVWEVWKSFGAPASPVDLKWTVHTDWWDELTLSHVPGSIRSTFGQSQKE
jgi:hypothetical protein